MISCKNMLPCQSREAFVTVTSYRGGIMDGYLRHPRLEGKINIQSLSQLMMTLNSLLDLEDCPGQPLPLVMADDSEAHMAIFRIQILFREHYTWQGKLVWQDADKETVFHSCIELMQLIDEILEE
ncbi:hypothetical protein [uncultured Acetatifactor sp.]|uniref:hypothetical protein n=1 Tax=uncultured Acetatifactor sp. TaxID=1671927 RepID=UPI00260B165F|nr:hypothetical protein [uncultured Acetatifactor sp.]